MQKIILVLLCAGMAQAGILHVVTYPVVHPVKAIKAVTYPVRHPIKTIK